MGKLRISNTKSAFICCLIINIFYQIYRYANQNNNLFTNSPINITRTGSYTNPPYTYSLQSVHTTEATVKAGAGPIYFP